LAAAGSVSALVGPQARGAKAQEVELQNLHLMEPENGGVDYGYEEDDEGDEEGEDYQEQAPAAAEEAKGVSWTREVRGGGGQPPPPPRPRTPTSAAGRPPEDGNEDDGARRRPPRWGRQLSWRRGVSASSVRATSSFASLEELMERGTMGP